jgi:hypothetical protein
MFSQQERCEVSADGDSSKLYESKRDYFFSSTCLTTFQTSSELFWWRTLKAELY